MHSLQIFLRLSRSSASVGLRLLGGPRLLPLRVLLVLLVMLVPGVPPAAAQQAQQGRAVDYWTFETDEQRQLFDDLAHELACPVCLGSSLDESASPIAEDMRREIWRQIHRDRSAEQIRQWMTERYGESVSTRPRGWLATVFLWLLPVLFGLLALLMLRYTATAGGRQAGSEQASSEQATTRPPHE